MVAAVRSPMNPAPPLSPVPQGPIEGDDWLDWLRQLRGIINRSADPAYLVADLPDPVAGNNPPNVPVPFEGQWAFALDGLKVGEAPAAGTGVPCYFSNGLWRRPSDDTQVAA